MGVKCSQAILEPQILSSAEVVCGHGDFKPSNVLEHQGHRAPPGATGGHRGPTGSGRYVEGTRDAIDTIDMYYVWCIYKIR